MRGFNPRRPGTGGGRASSQLGAQDSQPLNLPSLTGQTARLGARLCAGPQSRPPDNWDKPQALCTAVATSGTPGVPEDQGVTVKGEKTACVQKHISEEREDRKLVPSTSEELADKSDQYSTEAKP